MNYKKLVSSSKLFIFVLCCSLISSASSAHYSSDNHRNVTLKLKWLHQFQFAGYYAAQLKGYYRNEGLDVTILEGRRDASSVDFVLNDSAQYGISGTELISRRAQDDPVVMLAAIFQHSPYILISLHKSNIASMSDLSGKKVMASHARFPPEFRALLQKEKVGQDQISFVEHTWNTQNLLSGKIDAMLGYITHEPYPLIKSGVEIDIIRPIDYGIDFYGDLLFTTEQEISDHPERAEAFRRASIKGWQYALANIEELIDYIIKLPGVRERGITKDHLRYEALEMQKLIMPNLVEIGHINQRRVEQIFDTYKELELVNDNADIRGLIYRADTQNHILAKYAWQILTAILLLTFLIFIWNRQLRKLVDEKKQKLEEEYHQRLLAEKVAQESEERLQLALSAAQLGIWDSDIRRKTVYRNEQWAEMLGYSPSEIPPDYEGWRKLIHPDDYAKIRLSGKDHSRENAFYDNYEHRLKTKSGEWKWVLSLSKIVERDEEGNPQRLIGIHIDIDELKKNQEELRQVSDELMYTNRELEKFAWQYIINCVNEIWG